jgi:hypothetical protein
VIAISLSQLQHSAVAIPVPIPVLVTAVSSKSSGLQLWHLSGATSFTIPCPDSLCRKLASPTPGSATTSPITSCPAPESHVRIAHQATSTPTVSIRVRERRWEGELHAAGSWGELPRTTPARPGGVQDWSEEKQSYEASAHNLGWPRGHSRVRVTLRVKAGSRSHNGLSLGAG